MTNIDDKASQGIQEILLRYLVVIHAELIHSHDDVFLAEKIMDYLRDEGYHKDSHAL